MAYEVKPKESSQQNHQLEDERRNNAGIYDSVVYGDFNPSASSAAMGGAGGPTPTGHINFDQLYNANAGVAAREATQLQAGAAKKAQDARYGLLGAQRQFNQQSRTGTVGDPTAQQRQWAAHGDTGVRTGKVVQSAHFTPSGQTNVYGPTKHLNLPKNDIEGAVVLHSGARGVADVADKKQDDVLAANADDTNHVTESNEGLTSSVTRYSGGDTPDDPTDDAFYDTSNDPALEAAVRSGAAGEYTGPDSLADLSVYNKLLSDTVATSDEINALQGNAGISGMVGGPLNGALIGAAGRPGFSKLKSQYGDLNKTFDDATVASARQADIARGASSNAAKAYQDLLDEYEGRQGTEQKAAAEVKGKSDQVIKKAHLTAQQKSAFNDFLNGGSAIDNARNQLHAVAKGTSPIDLGMDAANTQPIVERATNAISPQSATNKGNRSPAWTDDDADVWASMSDSDWSDFNALTVDGQRQWIANRKKQLRGS